MIILSFKKMVSLFKKNKIKIEIRKIKRKLFFF